MPEDSIHQPNDKLLKATFSSPENARAFFEANLPGELVPSTANLVGLNRALFE